MWRIAGPATLVGLLHLGEQGDRQTEKVFFWVDSRRPSRTKVLGQLEGYSAAIAASHDTPSCGKSGPAYGYVAVRCAAEAGIYRNLVNGRFGPQAGVGE